MSDKIKGWLRFPVTFIGFCVACVVLYAPFVWEWAKEDESNDYDIICPVCGYYCLGNGGHGCIDKPYIAKHTAR